MNEKSFVKFLDGESKKLEADHAITTNGSIRNGKSEEEPLTVPPGEEEPLTVPPGKEKPLAVPPGEENRVIASMGNLFSFHSSFEDLPNRKNNVYMGDRILDDLVREMFTTTVLHIPKGSSSCDVMETFNDSEPKIDRRLKHWRDILDKRREIQDRVKALTGKKSEEVLFNRRTTLDERNKDTMKSILRTADAIKESPALEAPEEKSTLLDCRCYDIEPLPSASPQDPLLPPKRKGPKSLEIIGLPNVAKCEILGKSGAERHLKNTWLQSKVLDKRLEEKFHEIRKNVDFVPDLNNLQVIGTSILKLQAHNIKLLREEDIVSISSTTAEPCSEELTYEIESNESDREPVGKIPPLALQINNKEFIAGENNTGKGHEVLTKFTCDPFVRSVRHVLQITNNGSQAVSFQFKKGVYYYNRATLLVAQDKEFLFDTEEFRLVHGETYNLYVMYQPRVVGLAVELWYLCTSPRIFCSCKNAIKLRFFGKCSEPPEYMRKLNSMHGSLMFRSNQKEMEELTKNLASIAPLIEPPEVYCPYERELDEREKFNLLNPCYNCKRFDDLEMLKNFHKELKKPRERSWDLQLATIKMYIMRIENIDERRQMFNRFTEMLLPMKGCTPNLDAILQMTEQKDRTRFIYVRGVICNGIEEWESLMITLEETFFKPELQRYYQKLMLEEEEEEQDLEISTDIGNQAKTDGTTDANDNEALLEEAEQLEAENSFEAKATRAVLRKLRRSKYLRDALYIETYTHLSNLAEIIVSVIESTEIVVN